MISKSAKLFRNQLSHCQLRVMWLYSETYLYFCSQTTCVYVYTTCFRTLTKCATTKDAGNFVFLHYSGKIIFSFLISSM